MSKCFNHLTLGALALALGTLASGCGGEGRKPEIADQSGAQPSSDAKNANSTSPAGPLERAAEDAAAGGGRRDFRVATYNAGLAVGVLKYADERADPLVRALAEQSVDLLCVQEFWLEEHWKKLVEKTASTLPSTYRLPAEGKGGSCEQAEVAPLAACAVANCGSVQSHQVPMCLLGSCTSALSGISAGCFECLSASPRGRPEEIARACVNAPRAGVSNSSKRGGRRAGTEDFRVYSGSYGTGILTSAAILERDARVLPSALDKRAVLYTKLATPIGELNAFCTHLTANITSVPHPGGASWRRDQAAQIDALLAFVEEKSAGKPALLLGDLNTGPAIAPHISASLPDHYARFVQSGFLNPYAAQQDVQCTYCFDNPLEGGRGTRGLLIDHVMLRGFPGRVVAGQIMRPQVVVEPAGKPVRIGPSDHYGVSVTLSPRGS
jgi:endonuclease/exonuclease/phosphatase family metal-dependent hydrolase